MPTNDKNKVVYGLKNVHVWPILSTDDNGKPTYGTVINMPGATEMKGDPKGSSDPFYADDGVYYQATSNTGYSGSFTFANVPDEFKQQILGETVDANGVILEYADAQPKEFAIAFEFKGDKKKTCHLFYRCTATRPSINGATQEDKVDPQTEELDFTAIPRLDTGLVRAKTYEGSKAYATWFGDAPYESPVGTAENS